MLADVECFKVVVLISAENEINWMRLEEGRGMEVEEEENALLDGGNRMEGDGERVGRASWTWRWQCWRAWNRPPSSS